MYLAARASGYLYVDSYAVGPMLFECTDFNTSD